MVTTFDGSAVPPADLSALIADYVALERARIWRRFLVSRFGSLAALIVGTGIAFRWLPPLAYWVSGGLCAMAPVWAWIVELRCDWRLARRLEQVPGGVTYVVASDRREQDSGDS
jgi:hypothetical protein